MSNSGGPSGSWTRCICSVCSGHLEFDSDLAGETIQCPHCGMPTILFIPRIPLPLPPGRRFAPKVLACPDCGTPVSGEDGDCPGCGRVIERSLLSTQPDDSTADLGILSPTAAGAWLVMAILLVVVVGGPIYWWRSELAQVPKPESESQQKSRLQAEAEVEMLKESTNVIVGLNRIIRTTVADTDDNPYKWSGDVVAEFVNRVGGVERTNVMFKFGTDTGPDGLMHLRCSSESETERRSRQRSEKHEFSHWAERAAR